MDATTKLPSGLRFILVLAMCGSLPWTKAAAAASVEVWPTKTWSTETPAQAGLSADGLKAAAKYAGGRGCVVRHGRIVFTWGDPTLRGDVASAAKPIYSYFLFKAVETGRLPSLETRAVLYEPRLATLNAKLGYKDRAITFRELCNQTSCYGVTEWPGTAFDYSDWQMALFWDTLFLKVYGTTYATVDQTVFHPLLTDPLQCEDNPTLMIFGVNDRAGRLGISPRDYARFGLLYLRGGLWRTGRLLSAEHVRMATTDHLPAELPRTKDKPAEMIPGQRSDGAIIMPDDENEQSGSYSWLWWINGIDKYGKRFWPTAPTDAYACLGHTNGKRGLAVMPSLDIVVAWNDTDFDKYPEEPQPPGLFMGLIAKSVQK